MRALNPDLYFCKLEANFASFCPALSSSSPFKHQHRLCYMHSSLPFEEEMSQQNVAASPGPIECLLQTQCVLEFWDKQSSKHRQQTHGVDKLYAPSIGKCALKERCWPTASALKSVASQVLSEVKKLWKYWSWKKDSSGIRILTNCKTKSFQKDCMIYTPTSQF